MHGIDSRDAVRVLLIQVVLTVLISLAGLTLGREVAASALIGGGTATVANGFFAFWVFGRYRASRPGQLAMSFYGGEIAKLLVASLLFVAAFLWVEALNPVALLVAYLVVQVVSSLLAARYVT
jgi:ATP synthase protein I